MSRGRGKGPAGVAGKGISGRLGLMLDDAQEWGALQSLIFIIIYFFSSPQNVFYYIL